MRCVEGGTAGLTQPHGNGVAPLRVQIGEDAPGQRIQRLQHCHDMVRVAPETPENIGEDEILAGTRDAVFGAGRDHRLGKTLQGPALIR